MNEESTHKRQWRDYQTEGGARPVKDFMMALPDEDRATVLDEMKYVSEQGVRAARHIRGEIYEVRASYNTNICRILFAREGHFKHILLSLVGFQKKTQGTPLYEIELAERRLATARSYQGREIGRIPMEQDFLDEIISESTEKNPRFPQLLEEARQRRELLQKLAALRIAAHITQMKVARSIRTSQSAVARMEAGAVDPRLSSIQRYAASIGKRIEWHLVDA